VFIINESKKILLTLIVVIALTFILPYRCFGKQSDTFPAASLEMPVSEYGDTWMKFSFDPKVVQLVRDELRTKEYRNRKMPHIIPNSEKFEKPYHKPIDKIKNKFKNCCSLFAYISNSKTGNRIEDEIEIVGVNKLSAVQFWGEQPFEVVAKINRSNIHTIPKFVVIRKKSSQTPRLPDSIPNDQFPKNYYYEKFDKEDPGELKKIISLGSNGKKRRWFVIVSKTKEGQKTINPCYIFDEKSKELVELEALSTGCGYLGGMDLDWDGLADIIGYKGHTRHAAVGKFQNGQLVDLDSGSGH
jgi:hypothetical protein